jgi:hypothetical protein
MPSLWRTALSWVALALGFGSAAVTLIDITVRGSRQPMKVMEWVWPITGLYLGPAAVWAYYRWGRPNSHRWLQEHPRRHHRRIRHLRPRAHHRRTSPVRRIHRRLHPRQRARPGVSVLRYRRDARPELRQGHHRRRPGRHPVTVRVRSRPIRLDGRTSVRAVPRTAPSAPELTVYWFGMQIGMIIGSLTAHPVNAWLIRAGIKEVM